MESVKKRNELIANLSSVLSFLITYGLCIWLGYIEIINGLFTSTGENVGEVFETPVGYVIVCLLFFAVMYALVIFGIKLKNKIMVLLPLCYVVVFILSFVLLALLGSGSIGNETLYGIVEWVLVFALAPSFGIMWSLPLLLVVIIVLGLIVVTVVGLVKVFKKQK